MRPFLWALREFWLLNHPLSAQAHAPGRPSGADKEQKTAEQTGSRRPGLGGPPGFRANGVARRHGFESKPLLLRTQDRAPR